MGLSEDRHDALLADAEQFIEHCRALSHVRVGLSPHAPYTVPPVLLERIVQLSLRNNLPVAMHLAETRDELELLRDGSGPLRNMLQDLGAWRDNAIPLATRPMSYLRTLAGVDRALVIHGNYLDVEEIAFVAERRARMSVVYCPRTHAYFGHDRYPLPEMLKAGVRVVLGTDSRASNPDLDLLQDLRFVARRHPHVPPREIMHMATIAAATALGIDDRKGSLAVGKDADFVVLPIDDHATSDPYELVLGANSEVSRVFRAGQQVCGEVGW